MKEYVSQQIKNLEPSADVFNGFYHDTNILNETDENVKNSRLALLAFTRDVLTACLDMLAIKCPDKM